MRQKTPTLRAISGSDLTRRALVSATHAAGKFAPSRRDFRIEAGGNTSKVFESTETALDAIALFVYPFVVAVSNCDASAPRNDRLGVTLLQPGTEGGAVVSFIGKQVRCWRQRCHTLLRHPYFSGVSSR